MGKEALKNAGLSQGDKEFSPGDKGFPQGYTPLADGHGSRPVGEARL
jgi:hypothetical protein